MKNHQKDSVNNCREAREAISARLDCELDKEQTSRLESHIQECEACRRHLQCLEALNQTLKTELSEPQDTTALWARVSRAIDVDYDQTHNEQPILPPTVQLPTNLPRRNILSMAVAAGVVLSTGGLVLHYATTDQSGEVNLEIVNDFLTYRISGKKQDILGENVDLVTGWLATRVDFEIPVKSAESAGFVLTGGRLCSFLNRRLVALQYRQGDHALSFYIMIATDLDLPESGTHKIGNRWVSAASLKGLTNVIWQSEGLVFAAVSDLDKPQVFDFIAQQIGNGHSGPDTV